MPLRRSFRPGLLATHIAGHHVPVSRGCVRRLAAQLPRRLVIPEEDMEENFLKGSGPGGQKIVRLHIS